MRRALLAILAITLPMSTFAGFNALYDGVPDLELNSFVQKSARTFTMVVCNRGDTANGIGSIILSLRGSAGKNIERTIAGVSIQSGRCQSFEISSAGTFGKPTDRNYDIVATIQWDGARRELELGNNQYSLAPTVPMTDGDVISTSPSQDLWGRSNGTVWYTPTQDTSYTNNGYYNNTSTVDPINFSPAGPFYGQGTNGNVIYVYPNNNLGNTSYTYPCYNNSSTNYYGSSNNYHAIDSTNDVNYGTNCYNNSTYNTYNTYSTSNCSSGNCGNCYNNGNSLCGNRNCYNRYGNCNDSTSLSDFTVHSIRQNGGAREFIVNVCNNGASLFSGTSSNLELTIGNVVRSVSFSTSLAGNTCQDIYVQFGTFGLSCSGNYTVRAEVDTIRAIREQNESNNSLTQNVYVNYN